MKTDLQLNIYSFYKLGTYRLYDFQETQSLPLHERYHNECLRIMHIARESIMCAFSESPPQLHICAPMFFKGFPFPNIWFRYSPVFLPQFCQGLWILLG